MSNFAALKCVQCIVDYKLASLGTAAEDDGVAPVADAVTLVGGTAVCMEHIQVQRQSPLLAAVQQMAPTMNGQLP